MAQEFQEIERLILIAPAFNMMGVRAKSISRTAPSLAPCRLDALGRRARCTKIGRSHGNGSRRAKPIGRSSFDRLRPVNTTILHGLQDTVILPSGSSEFVEELLARDPAYPIELDLIPGDHRLSSPEHVERFHRLVLDIL